MKENRGLHFEVCDACLKTKIMQEGWKKDFECEQLKGMKSSASKKTGNRKKDVFVPILFLYFDKYLYKTLIYNVLLYNKITFTRFTISCSSGVNDTASCAAIEEMHIAEVISNNIKRFIV